MLMSFEQILPLKHKSNLHDPKIAQAIYYKSDGNLGNISNLLAKCAIKAIRNGSEIIDLDLINEQQDFRSTIKGRV
jgi:hypothetical protein